MNAPKFWIRIILFLFALLLGLVSSNANPVSSQPQGEGGFQWYAIPQSTVGGIALSPTGAGHVVGQGILRCPSEWPCIFPVSDKILFTQDSHGGLAIIVSDADVHDRWTWSYYFPGNPPEGGVPDITCWMQIRLPGEEGNDTGLVALITNCTPYGQLTAVLTFPSGCPCSFKASGAPIIAGAPAQFELGTWTAVVDYTDPQGIPTPAVAQDNMYLMQTPAVVLIHGWEASCGNLAILEQNIEQELAVSDDRVQCYGYHTGKGVAAPASDLERFVADFRQELGIGPLDEVDLVGHSMGGLVTRYYAQRPYCSTDIGSISMLGTPNEGVHVAGVHESLCHRVWRYIPPVAVTCLITDFGGWLAGVDLGTDSVRDMAPGSDILKQLNDGFILPEPPELPQYRAHAGLNSSWLGSKLSGSRTNDCFVSLDSVDGPNAVFDDVLSSYEPLTHGGGASLPGCDPPTLTDDMSVVQDLVVTIKGNPGGGTLAGEPLAQGEPLGAGGQGPMLMTVADYVEPSQSKTHQLSVPDGLGETGFVVYWLDAEEEPSLGVTLRRPNGQVVDPEDPDVVEELTVTGDGFLDVLLQGFVMSAPQAGDWEVSVEGLSVPEEGRPYLVVLTPDSQVVLSAGTAEPALPQGQPQIITATLFDGSTAIEATSISAQVGTPAGTEEPVVLQDDGSGGDEMAGDLIYSGTFTSTADCGGYGVLVTATGDSSEGTVTREQFGFFQSQVPGDAVRDPCNPDDDEDGLTDQHELNVVRTDPFEPDTDDDGMPDGYEDAHTCVDPLVDDAAADPDSDGLDNLTEYNQGTDPCAAFAPVGGIAQLPDVSDSSGRNYIHLSALAAAALVALTAGAWYARRRWLG